MQAVRELAAALRLANASTANRWPAFKLGASVSPELFGAILGTIILSLVRILATNAPLIVCRGCWEDAEIMSYINNVNPETMRPSPRRPTFQESVARVLTIPRHRRSAHRHRRPWGRSERGDAHICTKGDRAAERNGGRQRLVSSGGPQQQLSATHASLQP